MTIQVDNRGYRYLGGAFSSNSIASTFGLTGTTSSEYILEQGNNAAATSELYTAYTAIHGAGTIAIKGDRNSSIDSLDTDRTAIVVTKFLNFASSKTTPIIANWSDSSFVDSVPTSKGDMACLICTNGSSSGVDTVLQAFPGTGRAAFTDFTATPVNSDQIWVSIGPSHLGMFFFESGVESTFVYMGLLQSPVLPETDASVLFGARRNRLAGDETEMGRAVALNSNSQQNISQTTVGDYTFTGNVEAANTTGDPYVGRFYPRDDGGTFTGKARGWAPDLFMIDDNGASIGGLGTALRGEDLVVGSGAYSGNGLLDVSDFQNLLKVGEVGGRSLMMRIGN